MLVAIQMSEWPFQVAATPTTVSNDAHKTKLSYLTISVGDIRTQLQQSQKAAQLSRLFFFHITLRIIHTHLFFYNVVVLHLPELTFEDLYQFVRRSVVSFLVCGL